MRILSTSLFVLAATLCFGQGLTEEQAIQIALDKSFGVKTAQSELRRAQYLTDQAIAQLGFRLDGQAIYERYQPARDSFSGSMADSKLATLALSYPVDLAGLRQKATRAAKANEAAASDGIAVESLGVKEQVRRAYYNVLRAEWQAQVQQEALTAAKARLDNAKTLFNAGAIARFDVLRLETEVSRADAALAGALNNVVLTKQILNNAMSQEIEAPAEIDSPYEAIREDNLPRFDLSEGVLLNRALETRPELKQLSNLMSAQKFVTLTERGGMTPSLNLQALYTHDFARSAFTRDQVTFGAVLSIPIWDSGLSRARVGAAREVEAQTKLAFDRTRLSVSLEVQSALIQVRNALAQVEFAKKTVDLQSEALRLAELRYSAGEGILLDVTSADADLRAALGALANSRSDYLIAIAALKKAVGTDDLPLAQS